MAPGPKPQPAAVRDQKEPVRSTHQPRPSYAESGPVAVEAPKWLKSHGRKVWDRLAPALTAAKLLSQADAETFARYCRNFARWLKLQKVLDDEGETYETETYLFDEGDKPEDGAKPTRMNKLKRAHPAFMLSDRIERQLLAAEDRFGLNPAERQRIFVARAATGAVGDLFASPSAKPAGGRRPEDPAAAPSTPAEPIEAPEGFLN